MSVIIYLCYLTSFRHDYVVPFSSHPFINRRHVLITPFRFARTFVKNRKDGNRGEEDNVHNTERLVPLRKLEKKNMLPFKLSTRGREKEEGVFLFLL